MAKLFKDVYVGNWGEWEIQAAPDAPRRKRGGLDMRYRVNRLAVREAARRDLAEGIEIASPTSTPFFVGRV